MKTMMFTRAVVLFSFGTILPLVCLFQSCAVNAGQHGGVLSPIHGMYELRASHTATVLQDGRVLIAGGFKKGPDGRSQIYSLTAELFDPKTGSFSLTANMNVRRAGHTATLLQNGRVLIAGGFTENGITASAEVYDPSSKIFSPVGNMSTARDGSTATLLPNGDVLIAGGGDVVATASADLFRPATSQFSPTGAMTVARLAHTATLLPDGRVLILGGSNNRRVFGSAELFDPATNTFTPAGAMTFPRHKHAAIVLNDGHTLILGGSDERDWGGQYSGAEIYDWKPGKYTPISSMISPRFKFPTALVRLANGNVLICGGSKTVEIFDFLTKRFVSTAIFDQAHYYSTASLLHDGRVLIVGGYTGSPQSTDRAWMYKE
ncbi:MAG: hypothetical protein NTU47_01380 [Ignavibacteriales bacterium]|nr:hypothetical protein [Ignavibacteriales bacterium]